MHRFSLYMLIVVGLAAPARAETPSPAAARSNELPVALGVSSPVGWFFDSLGVSAYVGLGRSSAVRANYAAYDHRFSLDEPLASHRGRIRDYGIGGVWYAKGLWEGLMLDAGALRRDRDIVVGATYETTETRSTTYAGRVMIGWSWLLEKRVFLAIAAGLSVGRETGEETITPEDPFDGWRTTPDGSRTAPQRVDRLQVDFETYLRFGIAFGR